MEIISLDTPPKQGTTHLWADFVEFKVLTHIDKAYSRGDLHSLINRAKDTDAEISNIGSGLTKKIENRWADIINFIETRITIYTDTYPFILSDDKDTISIDIDNLTNKHNNYIKLLISSCLRHFRPSEIYKLTRLFEQISLEVFRQVMPKGSSVYATWANPGDNSTPRYSGNKFQKLKSLGNDIRCELKQGEDYFDSSDTGDAGVDIIGFHGLEDEREGIPISFVQCGCSPEFKDKVYSSSYERFSHLFSVMHRWSNYFFSPHDLRNSKGNWVSREDYNNVIVVDRLRILKISSQNNIHDQLATIETLDLVMQEKNL